MWERDKKTAPTIAFPLTTEYLQVKEGNKIMFWRTFFLTFCVTERWPISPLSQLASHSPMFIEFFEEDLVYIKKIYIYIYIYIYVLILFLADVRPLLWLKIGSDGFSDHYIYEGQICCMDLFAFFCSKLD